MAYFKTEFNESEQFFDAGFKEIIEKTKIVEVPREEYSGDYVVTPKNKVQVLETKGLAMKDDVTINAVEIADTGNIYEGSYEIVPSTEVQTVECSGMYMKDDVVCKEIPYYEVSNIDGVTVYIGKENVNAN